MLFSASRSDIGSRLFELIFYTMASKLSICCLVLQS